MVSSDVMYNGLPFPDEDFIKVTMERDLLIRRSFEHSPLLWVLLAFVATHRSALCYASVLLRGLTATCLHQWRAKNGTFHNHSICHLHFCIILRLFYMKKSEQISITKS